MRFIANGPDIPQYLLDQQAKGNVIFFCGAGVSVPAGLDTFPQLTSRIIENLNFEKARNELAEKRSFDRVFNALVGEFGRDEIDRQIYLALGTQSPKTLKHHRDILELSRGAGGSIQIVTTNFDRLFEKAAPKSRAVVPPTLPDLELNQSIDGIVYLHGRLTEPGEDQLPRYVISSSDFGRAYLAEGWATRFVKALREQYTLVLLGYSADDPPMHYLLEGLNSRDGHSYNSPIYVFTDKSESEAEEQWSGRGVTTICYTQDKKHSALWSTINAWAKAAKSPEKWTASVLSFAQQRPSELLPYQRSQVVQLVSTRAGAKAFADAEPPVSAEWLCVFDPIARYAEPKKENWEADAKEIDPQELFGLDCDPERPPKELKRAVPEGALNPLEWQKTDGTQTTRQTLQGWHALWNNSLPDRLHSLARWFGSQAHEPAAIWWAAGWRYLNPHMLWFVSNRLTDRHGKAMPPVARKIWTYYLESNSANGAIDNEYPWFEFEGILKQAGWTPATKRAFESCVSPTVKVSRPSLTLPRPPEGKLDELSLRQIVDLKVAALDRHGHAIPIPDEALVDVVRIIRLALLRISELMHEIGELFWHAPTLHPTGEPGETFHGRKEQFFLWFKELFLRLVSLNAKAAQREFESWPADEERMFPKLRLWAITLPPLLDSGRAFATLKSLSPDVIWDAYNHRELLFLLRASWPKFSARQRRYVERLFVAGPRKWEDEPRSDFRRRRASHAASNLRWLQLNGCELSDAAQAALERLKIVDRRWSDKWAESADDSFGPRGGSIREDTALRGLNELPIGEIISKAEERSEDQISQLSHFRPFRGLVAEHPLKALSALRFEQRRGNYPIRFWKNLLADWPDGASIRLTLTMARAVSALPDNEALELRYYTTSWLQKHIGGIYLHNKSSALEAFDGFFRPFHSASISQTDSSMGTSTVGGVVQDRSEVSVNKAINSPIGNLTEALWSVLPKKGKSLRSPPRSIATRLELLAAVPGNGGGHAISVLTKRSSWINHRYPVWFEAFLLPKFAASNPLAEAAWHGLAYNNGGLAPQVLNELKPSWLTIVEGDAAWSLDPSERRSMLQSLVLLSKPHPDREALFTFEEVRSVLLKIDDEGRSDVLWALANSVQEAGNWANFAKPFIESAWPKNLRFRSERTAGAFVHLAEKSGADFPEVVRAILNFVRPIRDAGMLTYRLSQERDEPDNHVGQHPRDALLLLNAITADDRAQMPYNLAQALEALSEREPSIREMSEFRRLRGLIE